MQVLDPQKKKKTKHQELLSIYYSKQMSKAQGHQQEVYFRSLAFQTHVEAQKGTAQ